MGESSILSPVVCRENAAALAGTPAADMPAASVSIFDLLDDVTHTRQATAAGEGQMIYSFQTLCAGTPLLARFALMPGTRPETAGALVTALDHYEATLPVIGGQSARGFGAFVVTRLAEHGAWADAGATYHAHLAEHGPAMRAALLDGSVGCGRPLLS